MQDFTVNPWEVKGKVDYDKLIVQFGTQPITDELRERIRRDAGDLHVMLRRKIFFSHRDLESVLKDYEEGKGFFLYTGRAPSLGMHIGHLIPFIFTKWLQEKFKVNLYIEITDDEKFMRNPEYSLDDTRKWAYENILDIIAVGFDPNRTFIFQDTEYIRNMYPLAVKIAKKMTFSEVKATFGLDVSSNIGIIFYPALQIVPTMFERKRCLIPAGIDQDPYWRLQRDIAESLGFFKASQIHSKFLPPITGVEGKMSSSSPESAIYLTDDKDTVKRKVMKYAFSGGQPTVELHRRLGGNPEIDVPFQWLYYFFEEDDNRIEEIREDYKSGKILSGELKQLLVDKLNDFLEDHRRKRDEAKDLVNTFKYDGKLARSMWEKLHE
ncbi:tryptophan--tRNA ligase [Sulfuracidifex metallicus]|uniref:Tryptophan--tRNA ligase n=1 Tax=Sulfuracidifex metallicus DSM 6482 = JCM 9184 TaxID=523847 RepID=A0A6A9QMD2_SULME|nr:tryptophan--tRNA ligase [Sulfuracidifex metallicus]MUN28425.1 tryptophan--tRNA ligase [Sulfuracidifex metallicus DSM 6482 = JCM 9184]